MKIMAVKRNIKIKAYEIDAMGIVSNINYIKWFEDIRHDFLDRFYPYEEMMKDGISPILMKTEVEYKRPLTIQDYPVGYSWVTKMDKTRWQLSMEIHSNDILCCTGVQSGCFWNMKTNRPTHVPAKLREAYLKELL